MAQRDHRGMTTVLAPVFRLERLNLTVPFLGFRLPGIRPGRHLLRRRPKGATMALAGTGIWRMSDEKV
jgi:hypothetical protein